MGEAEIFPWPLGFRYFQHQQYARAEALAEVGVTHEVLQLAQSLPVLLNKIRTHALLNGVKKCVFFEPQGGWYLFPCFFGRALAVVDIL